jgi:hypothetical protein
MHDIEWAEDHADRWVGLRRTASGRVRLGTVQRFGSSWFWAPHDDVHWFGPVRTRVEAQRALVESAPAPVEAQPGDFGM